MELLCTTRPDDMDDPEGPWQRMGVKPISADEGVLTVEVRIRMGCCEDMWEKAHQLRLCSARSLKALPEFQGRGTVIDPEMQTAAGQLLTAKLPKVEGHLSVGRKKDLPVLTMLLQRCFDEHFGAGEAEVVALRKRFINVGGKRNVWTPVARDHAVAVVPGQGSYLTVRFRQRPEAVFEKLPIPSAGQPMMVMWDTAGLPLKVSRFCGRGCF